MTRSSTALLPRTVALALAGLAASASAHADEAVDVVATDDARDGGAPPSSQVERAELEERLPRSAPDALRYEPGVYVQQTAHGQASPYIRGRTGQQTLLLFDGIRLNNSTFRQGPNQYFFTVDTHTIYALDVRRGGASTRWGSDAIGGVVNARPLEPHLALGESWSFRPRMIVRAASADEALGFRAQLDTQVREGLRLLAGAGSRHVGLLEGGGQVASPSTGRVPEVPSFLPDGRTQRGTGFREMTADGRLVLGLGPGRRLVAASYLYRQYDAPRTDKCPPPYAPVSECLRYDEQFRTLAYLAYDGDAGRGARTARFTLSFQRQHERRSHDRPAAFVQNGGRDDVDTFGATAALHLPIRLADSVRLGLRYGGDAYLDRIDSAAWTSFSDIDVVRLASRGQYLDGSTYLIGGLFADARVALGKHLALLGGARGGGARADAPADPSSETRAVHRGWGSLVGHAGVELSPVEGWSLSLQADRSFRAPNLDDLTSRQQTGPGFQIENPDLEPETALSLEAGLRFHSKKLDAGVWAYRSLLRRAIVRAVRGPSDCPTAEPGCLASWTQLQLVNLPRDALVHGIEASARAELGGGAGARATLAYAYGEGPGPADPAKTVPLSRIPPLNGTLELGWRSPIGLYTGAALRWATLQDRLDPSDVSDERIPDGGTPGFAVVDLRAGWRLDRRLLIGLALENVGDAAYRYHGSSVNGPGRGVVLHLEGGL